MFDKNMLDELSKLKVDRKRKNQPEEPKPQTQKRAPKEEESYYDDTDYDENGEEIEIIDEEEEFEEEQHFEPIPGLGSNKAENVSSFLGETLSPTRGINPIKYARETLPENDLTTDESEARKIKQEAKKNNPTPVDPSIKSKYMDDAGNINVVYAEPGKNVVNRKSLEERRLDSKMGALSDLLTKFKSEDEIEKEDSDPNVIIMDKESQVKKQLKKMDEYIHIKNDVDIKIALVEKVFGDLSREIERRAKLPSIGFDIKSSDYIRALYMKRSLDDMDVSRIFTLCLFLENPEKFPTPDTYEQVEYMNTQVGAKCKSLDLKRLITYISSDTEFNRTVELVEAVIKNPNFNASAVEEVFNFKCKEALRTLLVRYLKKDSLDPLSRVNVISIKQDINIKHRNIESSLSLLESLKTKLKVTHASLKEQIKRTNEQILATEEKITELRNDLVKMEKEITILLMLNIARQKNGYNIEFSQNIPVDQIKKQLEEYTINPESENVTEILENGIKEKTLVTILQNR